MYGMPQPNQYAQYGFGGYGGFPGAQPTGAAGQPTMPQPGAGANGQPGAGGMAVPGAQPGGATDPSLAASGQAPGAANVAGWGATDPSAYYQQTYWGGTCQQSLAFSRALSNVLS